MLWHDTKEEHPDTYRFLRQMSETLGVPITERSDGRSVTELFRDEGYLGNNRNAMCSRILKAEQGSKFLADLRAQGFHVVKVIGYSVREPERINRMLGHALAEGFDARFPIVALVGSDGPLAIEPDRLDARWGALGEPPGGPDPDLSSPVAVKTRSPRPDRPMKVSGLAPSAKPRRVISARPRVTSAARAFKPKSRPSHSPVAIASTFLTAPPTSTPTMSSLAYTRRAEP